MSMSEHIPARPAITTSLNRWCPPLLVSATRASQPSRKLHISTEMKSSPGRLICKHKPSPTNPFPLFSNTATTLLDWIRVLQRSARPGDVNLIKFLEFTSVHSVFDETTKPLLLRLYRAARLFPCAPIQTPETTPDLFLPEAG
ncbi:hypothetical protein MCOR25_001609 [Pyricularia grisea]|nr:hypothetical protein MCOR25_001609 [Pyricularia grisea]